MIQIDMPMPEKCEDCIFCGKESCKMDREKVIRIIDELIFEAQKEPTWKAENALRCLKKELLKEQEAVEPYLHDAVWICGNCDKEEVGWDDPITGEEIRYPFCRECGKKVKWDDGF